MKLNDNELIEFALTGIDIDIKECENDLKIIYKNLEDFKRGSAINPTFNKLEAEKIIRKLKGRLEYLKLNKIELRKSLV